MAKSRGRSRSRRLTSRSRTRSLRSRSRAPSPGRRRGIPYGQISKKIPHSPFASKQLTKLRYSQTVSLNPTDNLQIAAYNTFNLSSIYDPDVTGTGHQPFGRDQWAALYQKYTVTNVKITMEWAGNPAAGSDKTVGYMGVLLDNDSTMDYTDVNYLIEAPSISRKFINSNTMKAKVSQKADMKKHFHLQSIVGNADYTSLIGAGPANPLYAHVWFGPLDTGQALPATLFIVTIDYTVVFTEPVQFGQS